MSFITALHNWHEENGEMVSFAGWALPMKFSGIGEEHSRVREKVGIFDISHMGRIQVKGKDITKFLEHVLTRDVVGLTAGRCGYSLACNEGGGIRDDLVIDKFSDDEYLIVCNSSNRVKILNWLKMVRDFVSWSVNEEETLPESFSFDVEIEDKTFDSVLFAVQGPEAQEVLEGISSGNLPEKRYTFNTVEMLGYESLVSRTGYTGEDGFEIIPYDIPNEPCEEAINFWESILKAGEEHEILPCGLGSRDTLRLEAGMPLYGNDLSEEITPLEAKLDFVVDLGENRNFIGRKRLMEQKEKGIEKIRVGFKVLGKNIPRHGMQIKHDGEKIGDVTSGTFSPSLKKGIGMGYVPPEFSDEGTPLIVDIRNVNVEIEVVEWPFY